MTYTLVRIPKTVADAVDQYRKELDTPNVSRNSATTALLTQALRTHGIDPKPPTEEE